MDGRAGILLFGHGARDPDWARPFFRIRDAILQSQPSALVEMGFLELMQPSFEAAVDALAARGAREIVVVPVFMAAGSHVKRDLPQRAADAMERHPGVTIRLAGPVGEAAPVLAAMADYALDAALTCPA